MVVINKTADTISDSFNISEERRLYLVKKFESIFNTWITADDDTGTREVLNQFMEVAQSPEEQLYAAYDFGRIKSIFENGHKQLELDLLVKAFKNA